MAVPDEQEFTVFYRQNVPRVHGRLVDRTGSRDLAEVLTAETFERAYEARGDRMKNPPAPEHVDWVFGIADDVGERFIATQRKMGR